MSTLPQTLRRGDYLLLAGFCLLLFGFALGFGRTFSTHETIHCVNVREMIADGNWVIPHFGGRPWLERPPLPFWITVPIVRVLGDIPAAYRLAPMLAAIPCVLLVGWMASVWFGRAVGLLTGLALATVREFFRTHKYPEEDLQKLVLILQEKLDFKENLNYIFINPEPKDREMFFGDHFTLNPKILQNVVTIGYKRAMAVLRRYDFSPAHRA